MRKFQIGDRIKSLRDIFNVPAGSKGVIYNYITGVGNDITYGVSINKKLYSYTEDEICFDISEIRNKKLIEIGI